MAKKKTTKATPKKSTVPTTTSTPTPVARSYDPQIANPTLAPVGGANPYELTPQDIGRAANAQVDLQTRPGLDSLTRSSQQVATQGKGVQDRLVALYAGLGDVYKGVGQNFANAAPGQAAAMDAIGQGRVDRTAAGFKDAQDSITADAATRGGGLDGGASKALAAQAALANTQAETDRTAANTQQAQTSNAYRGLVETMAAIAPTRGAEAASQAGVQTAGALADIGAKRADLQASRGPMRAKAIQDISQQAFTNYATVQGLNLQGNQQAINLALGQGKALLGYDQLNNTAADQGNQDALDTRTADQRDVGNQLRGESNTIAWGHLDTAQDKLAWQKTRAAAIDRGGGLAGLTPWQRIQFQKGNDAVRGSIRSVKSTGDALHQQMYKGDDGKQHHYTQAQVRAALMKKFNNDADVVDAGIDLAHGGGLKPEIIARLRGRHIGVPSAWDPKRPPSGTGAQGN